MDSQEPSILQWVVEDSPNTLRLLLIGNEQDTMIFSNAVRAKADEDEKCARNLGLPKLAIEIFKLSSLEDDIKNISSKRIDYFLLLVNPADQGCLDRAELEFARLHFIFHAANRVQLLLCQRHPSRPLVSNTQLKVFSDRYQIPPISSIEFQDDVDVKYAAASLCNTLRRIKNIPL